MQFEKIKINKKCKISKDLDFIELYSSVSFVLTEKNPHTRCLKQEKSEIKHSNFGRCLYVRLSPDLP